MTKSLLLPLLSSALVACGGSAPADPPAHDGGADQGVEVGPKSAFSLEAGEASELSIVDGVARVRLSTPTRSEKFVLILGSTRFDRTIGVHPYSLSFDPFDDDREPERLSGCSLTSDAWKDAPSTVEPPKTGSAPAIGTKRKLETAGGAIDAEVVAVTKTAVVWADVTPEHPAKLEKEFLDAFLKDWDEVILPRERAIFGVESDLDGDGHVGLVFTKLTYDVAVAYFTGCDLKAMTGCGPGNKGEFLYLTPPDAIAPPYNTPSAMKEILAHEAAHLAHFGRKVLRNGLADQPDSAYMAEGLGALAQDVIGYQSGNLYVTLAGLSQIDQFSLAEVLKDRARYDSKRDGPMRGGSYLFARFLYDRAGGDEANADGTVKSRGGPALLRALLDAKESVTSALGTVAKANLEDLAMDFYTALAMSNREKSNGVRPKNPCFAFLPTSIDPVTGKQRGADLFATFHGSKMSGPTLQKAASPTGTVRVGGVELIAIDAADADELHLSVTVPVDAKPRVRIARIK